MTHATRGKTVLRDDAGLPLTVYHGSRLAHLKAFDLAFAGTGVVGVNSCGGIFFTSSRENAAYYTDPVEIIGGHQILSEDGLLVYGEAPHLFVILENEDFECLANFGPFETTAEAETAARHVIEVNNGLHATGKTGVIWQTAVDDHIVAAHLTMRNPLVADGGHAPSIAMEAKAAGHDGAIIRNTLDGQEISDVYVVFDPSQVEIIHPVEPAEAPTP